MDLKYYKKIECKKLSSGSSELEESTKKLSSGSSELEESYKTLSFGPSELEESSSELEESSKRFVLDEFCFNQNF